VDEAGGRDAPTRGVCLEIVREAADPQGMDALQRAWSDDYIRQARERGVGDPIELIRERFPGMPDDLSEEIEAIVARGGSPEEAAAAVWAYPWAREQQLDS
jgi:hypothetical protein